jgi:hypothetical protein
MNIWNRIGDLAKGTRDFGLDVALGFPPVAIAKFAWDIGTAPLNDREEFNGILSTFKQASIDLGKNLGRPIGGVIAAVEATNRNLIREPLSALTLFAQRDADMGISDSWKKAWEARNEISFGQALTTQFGQAVGQFLPDDLTPKYFLKAVKELIKEKPNLLFANWMDDIEKIIHNQLKMKLLDLPDENYWTLFDNGATPEEVAQNIIDDLNDMETELLK